MRDIGTELLRFARLLVLVVAALGPAGCVGQNPSAPPPPSANACGPLLPLHVLPGAASADTTKTIFGQAHDHALLYLAGLAIDADGAPDAYHPDGISGLDALANAGRPGNWWGLATDRHGRPFVQGITDPNPGFYVSKTALVDSAIADPANPRRYVDARTVPYIVLPGGRAARNALEGIGAELGDLAVVLNIRTGNISAAVWADIGPSRKLGEGSMGLARALGYANISPRNGGTHAPENITLVFPGSGGGFPRDTDIMAAKAMSLLAAWGGRARLQDCAAELRRR